MFGSELILLVTSNALKRNKSIIIKTVHIKNDKVIIS